MWSVWKIWGISRLNSDRSPFDRDAAERHRPVMLAESIAALAVRPAGRYVDCTFGRGGHSRTLLAILGAEGRLLALDKDADAVDSSEARSLSRDARFRIEQASYAELSANVAKMGWQRQVDGILMDLGVSSPQLDEAARGFSFLRDGPLDMRMDRSRGITAAEWLRSVSERELGQVLREFGEERYARRVAKAIVNRRAQEAIVTTGQLASVVRSAIPRWEQGQHPATRTFQAIRIRVNQELSELQQSLTQAVQELRVGGRLVVIAFHSLEDRIVKRFIRDEARGFAADGDIRRFSAVPVVPRLSPVAGPLKPAAEELRENPRARSAILRAAERLSA